jgi:hypothetical protein
MNERPQISTEFLVQFVGFWGKLRKTSKDVASPAWHSEFKGRIFGEKFPLDRLGPKEYFFAGCYPSDSLVNPSTSALTFRSGL